MRMHILKNKYIHIAKSSLNLLYICSPIWARLLQLSVKWLLILKLPKSKSSNCKTKRKVRIVLLLHWLPMSARIQYKVACLTFNSAWTIQDPWSLPLNILSISFKLTPLHANSDLLQIHACFLLLVLKQNPLENPLFHTLLLQSGMAYHTVFDILP